MSRAHIHTKKTISTSTTATIATTHQTNKKRKKKRITQLYVNSNNTLTSHKSIHGIILACFHTTQANTCTDKRGLTHRPIYRQMYGQIQTPT